MMSPSQAPPKYTLYTAEASFRAFAVLIAAEYNGVSVATVTGQAAATKGAALSPVGKLPVLQAACSDTNNSSSSTATNAIIFSSHAAARYVGGLRSDTGLLGCGATDRAAVDAWMDWCATDVELPATVWFYPVAGYMPFHAARCVCVFSVVGVLLYCIVVPVSFAGGAVFDGFSVGFEIQNIILRGGGLCSIFQ